MPVLENGYEIIDDFLAFNQLKSINDELEFVSWPAKSGGIRNAEKKFASIRKLAVSGQLNRLVQKYLGGAPGLVRALLFNKTPENNWLVTWHQDKTVAVSSKFDDPEWGPWSIKDGVNHVQPPLEVLNRMITLRIHLDDTNARNGCLNILPESQKQGLLTQADIREYVKKRVPVICPARAGSVLVMRPHILHSSGKATKLSQRRVLHLEYSSYKLPQGIAWA